MRGGRGGRKEGCDLGVHRPQHCGPHSSAGALGHVPGLKKASVQCATRRCVVPRQRMSVSCSSSAMACDDTGTNIAKAAHQKMKMFCSALRPLSSSSLVSTTPLDGCVRACACIARGHHGLTWGASRPVIMYQISGQVDVQQRAAPPHAPQTTTHTHTHTHTQHTPPPPKSICAAAHTPPQEPLRSP